MWPLLFFSIAAVTIVLERTVYLLFHNLKVDDMKERVLQLAGEGKTAAAEEYLSGLLRRRMGAGVLLTLVRGLPGPERGRGVSGLRLEKAVEAEAEDCINSLEKGFNFLTALGSIAPLTGFLGTVSGMIGAFRSISQAEDVNAQIVANGIYEALITTVFGLIIAIIAMVAHSLFSHAVDTFTASLEKTCSDLFIKLLPDEGERRTAMRV